MSDAGHQTHQLVARPPIHTPSFEKLKPERSDEIFLYYEEEPDDYRYKLTIVDRSLLPSTTLQYATAVFLIPAGRESEYMFSRAGLNAIAQSAQTARLIAVSFGRKHTFLTQQFVQEELTFPVQVIARQGKFLPQSHSQLQTRKDIPFMALDGIGKRSVLVEDESKLSGSYIVEQVQVDERQVRRLYFMDNPFLIQTEVSLKQDNTVDKTYAAFDYHKSMAAGIVALGCGELERGLMIGLGGGGLVNFLETLLPTTKLTVIELDPDVVKVAKEYFGVDDSRLNHIRVGDGLKVCAMGEQSLSDYSDNDMIPFPAKSMSFLAIDVDSKDAMKGMSCPPQAFVEIDYLRQVAHLLSQDGVLVINVSARDPAMLQLVCRNVKAVFSSILLSNQEDDDEEREDVNVVVFAKKAACDKLSISELTDCLEKRLQRNGSVDEIVAANLAAYLDGLSPWNEELSGESSKKSNKKKTKRNKKRGKRK